MRILFFVHSLRRGGAERVLLEIALGLRARGHDVEVVAWLDVDEYREERYASVPRHFLMPAEDYRWPWSIPKTADLLKKAVENFRPDIIEIYIPIISWVAAWAHVKVPHILVIQGYGSISRKGSLKQWCMKMIDRVSHYRLNTNFIISGPPMREVASNYLGGISLSRFHYVPNGIDISAFQPRRRVPGGAPTIMMLGTLCILKGQARGIKAISFVLKHIPNARLLIVGKGEYRQVLEDLVKEMGLEANVEIAGYRQDAFELMSKAHLFWHLSECEGLPMVILEAMALGLPVVGFDVHGIQDTVVDGETGYLVPFDDVQAVARKTVEILQDESISSLFSRNGRKRVEDFFTFETMVSGHERVLLSRLGENTNAD